MLLHFDNTNLAFKNSKSTQISKNPIWESLILLSISWATGSRLRTFLQLYKSVNHLARERGGETEQKGRKKK